MGDDKPAKSKSDEHASARSLNKYRGMNRNSNRNLLVDVFSTCVNECGVKIASVEIESVFNSLCLEKGLVSLFCSVLLLTWRTEAIAEIPEKHAAAVQGPNRFLWGERIVRSVNRQDAIDDLGRE